MPDWYRDHNISPEAAGDDAYYAWAQDNGLYVDLAGNVDYAPPDRDQHPNPLLHLGHDGCYCRECEDGCCHDCYGGSCGCCLADDDEAA